MASYNGNRTCFSASMYNQNFPPPQNNFIMNPRGERPAMQPFQRFPNPTFRPFQSPERFMPGNFPNRPRFQNFPNPMFSSPGFRSRPPVPENISTTNNLHCTQRPRFGGSFDQSFKPWNRRPSFPVPRPPFQNHPRGLLPSKNHFTETPFHANRNNRRDHKQNKRETRKLKDDNTVKPFSCDTCDRAFVTEGELKSHFSLHIKCDERNCTFTAHPKIVAIHKKLQHETGYADEINKLKDDAEIQKWREARRSRFPTTENIRKRQAEQSEKEARGEVLESKEFGKFKRQKNEDGNVRNHTRGRRTKGHRGRRNFHDRNSHFKSHPNFRPVILNVDSDSSDSDSHISLKKFSGIPSLTNSANEIFHKNENQIEPGLNNDVSSVCDMDQLCSQHVQSLSKQDSCESVNIQNLPLADDSNNVVELDQTSTLLNGDKSKDGNTMQALFELPTNAVSNLSTVGDSDDEAPAAMPIIKSKENEISTSQQDVASASDKQKEDSAPANSNARFNNENSSNKGEAPKRHQRERPQRDHYNKGHGPAFIARKSTLLEKLLADDIRHERNMVMQCVRHIINKNFFGIGNN